MDYDTLIAEMERMTASNAARVSEKVLSGLFVVMIAVFGWLFNKQIEETNGLEIVVAKTQITLAVIDNRLAAMEKECGGMQ